MALKEFLELVKYIWLFQCKISKLVLFIFKNLFSEWTIVQSTPQVFNLNSWVVTGNNRSFVKIHRESGLTLKTLGVWKDRKRRERKTRCLSEFFSFTCTRHSCVSWHTTSSKCWVCSDPNAVSVTSSDAVCSKVSVPSPSTLYFSSSSGVDKHILTDFFFWVCPLLALSGYRITWTNTREDRITSKTFHPFGSVAPVMLWDVNCSNIHIFRLHTSCQNRFQWGLCLSNRFYTYNNKIINNNCHDNNYLNSTFQNSNLNHTTEAIFKWFNWKKINISQSKHRPILKCLLFFFISTYFLHLIPRVSKSNLSIVFPDSF